MKFRMCKFSLKMEVDNINQEGHGIVVKRGNPFKSINKRTPGSLTLVAVKEGYDFQKFSDCMVGFLLYLWMVGVTRYFSSKQTEFELILSELGDFTVYEEPDGIEKLNNNVDKMTICIGLWLMGSVALAGVFNFFVHCEDYVEDNCGFLVYSYYPVQEFFTRKWRRITLLLQCSTVIIACCPTFFGPWITLNVSEYLVNRMDHLIKLLRIIPTLPTRKERHAQIAKCVRYHIKILELADMLTENSYGFLLIHVPYTTFMLTLICIQLLTEITYLNLADLGIWLFYITLCCVFGERLFAKSYQIGEECYANIPFDGDLKTQKELMFMIQTNRLIGISAGMNAYCNHEKLVQIVKTSYSCIALIANTDEDM